MNIARIIALISFSLNLCAQGVVFQSGELDSVLALSQSSGKPVFLDFTANWCLPCRQMEKYTYPNAQLGSLVNENFVAYKVDVAQFKGMDIAEEYDVINYPTILLLDSNGMVQLKLVGYKTAEELVRFSRDYLESIVSRKRK